MWYRMARRNILRMLNENNRKNDSVIVLILFLRVIGTDRFNISNKRYADPAIHAGMICKNVWLFKTMMSLFKVT